MSEEGKFWSIFNAIIGCVLIVGFTQMEACNRSDNQLYNDAIAKGCSIRSVEHGHQILCGKNRSTDEISALEGK